MVAEGAGLRPSGAEAAGRYREARRVTLVGAALDLVLGVVKVAVGWVGGSQALVADGVHSFSDLATDALVVFAARHGYRDADEDHPYGHGRIETAATVALGVALIAVSAGIAWDAVRRLFHPELLLVPGAGALLVAFLSVVSKEWIYRYTMRVARRLRSRLLRANAWHSRSDALSSVIVMVGVGGVMLGLDYLDAIAAVGVAGMVGKIGWDLGWSSVRELVDTGLDAAGRRRLNDAIMDVDGVRSAHSLRTRRMGGDVLVDVHVLVEPRLSVSEGHYVAERVRERLVATDDEVSDVLVHVDPEDDETAELSHGLPPRHVVMEHLRRRWAGLPAAAEIREVTLHYLGGRVGVDVVLPLAAAGGGPEGGNVSAALREAAQQEPWVAQVRVRFE